MTDQPVHVDPTDEDDTRLPCEDCGVAWSKHLGLDHPWKVTAYIDEHTTVTTIGPSNSSEYVR